MADIKRTLSELLIDYADNNVGAITPSKLRNGFKSVFGSTDVYIITNNPVYNATADNIVIMYDYPSPGSVILPAVAITDESGYTYSNKEYVISNISKFNIDIINSSDASLILSLNTNECVYIVADSTSWRVVTKSIIITAHNNLVEIQGGDEDYKGHIRSIDNDRLLSAGNANGFLLADSNGLIPIEKIPASLLGAVRYQGAWNASTNSPTLINPPDATTKGHYYVVATVGTQFSISWSVGDWIISNGSVWQKIDNTDAISSVFGRTGAVVARSGDYKASMITNVPSGNIVATTVQTAINELDSEKAPTNHASTTNVYGVGDANNFGHVKVDAIPTNGSMNAVSSDGVFDAIASLQPKHSTYASSDGGNAGWTTNITVSIPKTIQYADRQSIFNVQCIGGVSSAYQWTARVMLSIKIQGGVPSYKLVILDGDNYNGFVYGRYNQDTDYHYFTPYFYICPWGYTVVELESGNLPESFTATYVPSLPSYAVAATVYDNYLESNTGIYGGVKLKDDGSADKSGYRGLSVGGVKRLVLMSHITNGHGGLYNESDNKWLVLLHHDGTLYTDYTPPISSDGNQIATTAWVKDVCPQLGSGFSPGTKIWYGTLAEYQAISNKDANTIYHCY